MRRTLFAALLTGAPLLLGAQHPVINEVVASNRSGISDRAGSSPDWMELYNPGGRTITLTGYRLVLGERQHVLGEGLQLKAGGHVLLWCDGDAADGNDHIAFRLPREGGTLLLVAPDGSSIVDIFRYPELRADIAYGRVPDGSATAAFLTHATPGAACVDGRGLRAPVEAPLVDPPSGWHLAPGRVTLTAGPGEHIWYTTDGSLPDTVSGHPYAGPLPLVPGRSVRAISVRSGHLPSDVSTAVHLAGPEPPVPVVALTMAPRHLEGPELGIDTEGLQANYSRTGRDWERPCTMQWIEAGPGLAIEGGVRIFGSGSRGLPKRSFKLVLRDRFGGRERSFPWGIATGMDECILRADAAPNAFLKHLLLEDLVSRAGLQVDIQRSLPVWLTINGADRGLYRAMPPKDAQWIGATHQVEAVDLLDGPAQVALSGDREHWHPALQALLDGPDLAEVNRTIEVGSLLDLACVDLYTGRADHELNVRCWRPRTPEGRWRWVLFDLDLWAPVQENTVQRMGLSTLPVAPYLPQLLADPVLEERFLARYALLMNGPFSPEAAVARLDSLRERHRPLMERDQALWSGAGEPALHGEPDDLREFVLERPRRTLHHLAGGTGRRSVDLRLDPVPAEGGSIVVRDAPGGPVPSALHWISGVPLAVEAVPAEGWEFAGWRGIDTQGEQIELAPERDLRVRALFRPARSGGDLP